MPVELVLTSAEKLKRQFAKPMMPTDLQSKNNMARWKGYLYQGAFPQKQRSHDEFMIDCHQLRNATSRG